MQLQNILQDLQAADPEFGERISPRRRVIKSMGRAAALTALPLAFGSLLKKAYGKPTATVKDVLNYALTLEYLEAEFYTKALDASGLLTGAARDAITVIRNHEDAHVAFLVGAINATFGAGSAVPKPTFDFSGGDGSGSGPFATAFSNYDLFLAVAQTFEDTGVRAYKGGAGDLMSAPEVLTHALNIHSVEARHASKIRQMRRARGGSLVSGDLRPWITGKETNVMGADVSASYASEETTVQLTNITITGLQRGSITITAAAASESFDEPLSMPEVLAIVNPFIVG